ncbi:MAG: peptidoglycan DD-metalloendopeptidase family protein [Peptococcaceae bacterium]|nr:peptidoglycan DD-metalloendopeptidase family protein [Peptococcaceae bacterium]
MGKINVRRVLALTLLCLLCLSLLPLGGGLVAGSLTMSQEDREQLDQAMEQMEEVNRQIKELTDEQDRITAQQKGVLGEIKRLTNLIVGLENEIQELDGQIAVTNENINSLNIDIEVKTGEVDQRAEYLSHRLNQLYVDGDVSLLDVLFASTSLTDFLTRYDLMSKVVDNDMELLTGLKTARAELEGQKRALEEVKAQLEEETRVRREKSDDLGRQRSAQNQMAAQLEADLMLSEEAEDELEKLSDQLKKFVAEIQARNRAQYMGSGTMGWPVPGRTRISSEYGWRNHPILRVQKFHTGIDIPAPQNTPAVACETGKVIMATTYGGFGKTVILDHGGGVASQYSHLYVINVSLGQIVVKGERVGGVGTTGLSTGNHLHFQIMLDGQTVNPLTHSTYFVNPQ